MKHMFGFLVACFLFVGCEQPIEPFSEPTFRLRTISASENCKEGDKKVCRWTIQGTIDSQSVVEEGDNPFSDCTDCVFNQKFSMKDGSGTIHFFYYKLPKNEHIPVLKGEKVTLLFLRGDSLNRGFAALLTNERDEVLFLVTSGAGGELFLDGDKKNLQVAENNEKVVGTETNDCGTKNYRELQFTLGDNSISVIPGNTGVLVSGNKSYAIGVANRYNWSGLQCSNLPPSPFSYYLYLQRN